MKQPPTEFHNILVVHFGQLGDMILTLPAFTALRERFPDARITVLSDKTPSAVLGLVNVCDDTMLFNRSELRQMSKVRAFGRIVSVVREIRRRRFDLVVDLHSLYESNIISFLSGAGWRLLAKRGNRSLDYLSNFQPEPQEFDRTRHLAAHYLGVVAPLGAVAAERFPPIDVGPAEPDDNGGDGTLVGMFLGAGHRSRCWPVSKFAILAARLVNELGCRVDIFLGPEERDLRETITTMFPAGTVIREEMSIAELARALGRLDLLISNDTGPMHLAGLVGTPIVLVMDRRAPATYIPNVPAITVINDSEIGDIEVGAVFSAARPWIEPAK